MKREITLADYEKVAFIHIPQLSNGSVAKITTEKQTQPDLHKALLELDRTIKAIDEKRAKKKS
ncbi:hypothetical protein [Helicobacter sp. UBA3407]|uniref:hypothetical protein n=1 Tax=Helicobacter TaxID=209 RepID=UPI0026234500|nr:hypothetical protein [Helicobacter sp. UBA3407]